MLVAPPGAFKTTITETMDEFSGTQVISDLNVQSLIKMKEHFLSGHISTMAFSDFSKLYKRHGSVSSNVEGIIMALAEEGFRKASFQSQSMSAIPARCAIIGGMTTSFFDSMVDQWDENGFLRRFLFCRYVIEGMDIVEGAINEWRKAEFDMDFVAKIPTNRTIAYKIEKPEIDAITRMLRHQPNRLNASILLQKIYCVLKWKFAKEPGKAMQIMKDFAPCLSKEGGVLVLRESRR